MIFNEFGMAKACNCILRWIINNEAPPGIEERIDPVLIVADYSDIRIFRTRSIDDIADLA
jgi:hypothetical protein